jgi:hypothetical protein
MLILKSLEEPIAGTLFILVSSEPHRLLPTIRSRCQTISHATAAARPVRSPGCAMPAWRRRAVAGTRRWLAAAGARTLSAKGERTARFAAGRGVAVAKASMDRWLRQPRWSTRREGREASGAAEAYARVGAEVVVRPDPGQPGLAAALFPVRARAAAAAPGAEEPTAASSWHSIERRYNTRPSASSP